jgi:hypothetical protein
MVREVVARLAASGWVMLPEHTFNLRGEHGSIDVLAWQPGTRAVLVVEVKTLMADLQDLLSTLDRKRRLAPALARELGWKPMLIGTILVMPAETQARNAIDRFRPIFDATYPARGREIRRWLACPDRELRGVWFLLNFAPGSDKRRPSGSRRVRLKRRRPTRSESRLGEPPPRAVARVSDGPAGGEATYHRRGQS